MFVALNVQRRELRSRSIREAHNIGDMTNRAGHDENLFPEVLVDHPLGLPAIRISVEV